MIILDGHHMDLWTVGLIARRLHLRAESGVPQREKSPTASIGSAGCLPRSSNQAHLKPYTRRAAEGGTVFPAIIIHDRILDTAHVACGDEAQSIFSASLSSADTSIVQLARVGI